MAHEERTSTRRMCLEVVKRFEDKLQSIKLCLALNLPVHVISTLTRDNEHPQELAYGVIEKWLHHYPHQFTLPTLQSALIQIEEYSLASDVERLILASSREPGVYRQRRRTVIEHVVKRNEETTAMKYLKERKQLIIVNGPAECGRTVFLNEIHNNIITEYDNSKIVYYPVSSLIAPDKDIVEGLCQLLCQLNSRQGMDSLKQELFAQAENFTPFVLILDLSHAEKSLRSIKFFLDSIFRLDCMPPQNLSIILSTCGCSTKTVWSYFQNYAFACEIVLHPFDEDESRQLLARINPAIDPLLAQRLYQICQGYPAELCILARMSKDYGDSVGFLQHLDAVNQDQILEPHAGNTEDTIDMHLVDVLKSLKSPAKRGLLSQLLVFPYCFSCDMMIKFTEYSEVTELRHLADQGHYLLSYDPATRFYYFSNKVRHKLLTIIKSNKYFPDEKLYMSHYYRIHLSFCRGYVGLLHMLGLHFLNEDVRVAPDVITKYLHPGTHYRDTIPMYKKATKAIKRNRQVMLYCVTQMVEDLDTHGQDLDCLLELSTCYVFQKFVVLRKIMFIYKRLLSYYEQTPANSIRAAKTKVFIVFFYLLHLSWEWYSDQAIVMVRDAIRVLKDTTEYEALAVAYFKLGRLLIAKGKELNDAELCTDGLDVYKSGYLEWNKLSQHVIARNVLLTVARRHEAVLQCILGNMEESNSIICQKVLPVYEELRLERHPFYATACCFHAKLMMRRKSCDLDEVKRLIELSISIRDDTLGVNHSDTVASLKSLGMCYRERGEGYKALTSFKMAADAAEYVLGETDTTALIYRQLSEEQSKLGITYDADCNLEKADKILAAFQNVMDNDMMHLVMPNLASNIDPDDCMEYLHMDHL